MQQYRHMVVVASIADVIFIQSPDVRYTGGGGGSGSTTAAFAAAAAAAAEQTPCTVFDIRH